MQQTLYSSNINNFNMSNEFNSNQMRDNINYNLSLKDLNSMNEIPKVYLNKQRVVKEHDSLGGFKIYEENLKKRVDPSSYIPSMGMISSSNYTPVNDNFLYSRSNLNQNPENFKQTNSKEMLSSQNTIVNPYSSTMDYSSPVSEHLISMFELEVQKLKKEAELKFENASKSSASALNHSKDLKEAKTYNEYLAFSPSRVQQIKHVTTQFKPEYISLEELQKQKDEHLRKLLETENLFYERKKRGDKDIDKYNSLYDGNIQSNLSNFYNDQLNYSNDINRNDITDKGLSQSQTMKNLNGITRRSLSTGKLQKNKQTDNKPLDQYESTYIRKFMNHIIKKKYKMANEQNFTQKDEWNKTKVRSLNIKSVNPESVDGLPGRLDSGHLDKKDYSLYYLSIESDSPRSLSLKSVSSRSLSGQKLNRRKIRAEQKMKTNPIQYGSSQKNIKEEIFESKKDGYDQNVAFAKMIFNLLDVDKTNKLSKTNLNSILNLDMKLLSELGFESKEELIEGLMNFTQDDEITQSEFVGFLLSRSKHNEQYLYNYVNGNITEPYENKQTKSEFYKTGFSSNNDLQSSKYNISKSAQYMINLKSSIVNEKLQISYNDYKDFICGFKPKRDLNITIPKPPSFYDKPGKKQEKINKILEERKEKEDQILSHKFKANELKREIFINELGNIIESEKKKRHLRQEKIKQKIIENMCPFSFYESDEKKYKNKLQSESKPLEFLPFKANPIPWTSQVNLYEDIITKQKKDREIRVEERARQNLQSAKLPPRMEMHERKKKLQEEEIKAMEKNLTKSSIRSKSMSKVAKVPDFAKEYETFMKEMEKKKSIKKPTEPVPFTFHEPKVSIC